MDNHFGHYRLKRAERQLLGPDGSVELAARSFDILVTLLDRPDAVVGKTELLDSVWPDMVVGDNTLQVHISALRKALAPGMIMTVHQLVLPRQYVSASRGLGAYRRKIAEG
ncbi:hypothetical protein MESS2_280054 [Mesorhizobium metallidurans STM 2683]|uniref:OmpR/PhoB-type domain-containing protein n=1 Tax=Mesorhizobium metallidurans STM 2683 TaxID=1297569 RepID=M5F2X6_9HYPH|nr:winged helix-turn-helix domain-containing protein [Mesorhizobium metallidurans]CCV06171.1 hypothetical protein MESS2_280054 [Mesorhizobium metallidurans STM 2683]